MKDRHSCGNEQMLEGGGGKIDDGGHTFGWQSCKQSRRLVLCMYIAQLLNMCPTLPACGSLCSQFSKSVNYSVLCALPVVDKALSMPFPVSLFPRRQRRKMLQRKTMLKIR